jgi:hypothetical protein
MPARPRFSNEMKIAFFQLLKGLGGGLTTEAVKAVKRMVFYPAQLDGKPVDSERVVEYSFMIY